MNSTKLFYPNGIYANINGTRGHFITKEIEVNQGHSKTKTYRPNDLRGPNEFSKNDENLYVNSQTTNFDHIPPAVLQPPPISSANRPPGSNDESQTQNTYSYGNDPRGPKSTSYMNFTSSGDLAGSGNIYFLIR